MLLFVSVLIPCSSSVLLFLLSLLLAVVFCAPRCGRVLSSSLDVAVWIPLSPFSPHTPAIYWFRALASIILHAGNPTPAYTSTPTPTHARTQADPLPRLLRSLLFHARTHARPLGGATGPRCYLSLPILCLVVISSLVLASLFLLFARCEVYPRMYMYIFIYLHVRLYRTLSRWAGRIMEEGCGVGQCPVYLTRC